METSIWRTIDVNIPVAVPREDSLQGQFSNSSKFDVKRIGGGRGTFLSEILAWLVMRD